MTRELTFSQAILEATVQCMEADPSVTLMGLGATDPKGIFGTTQGLEARFGPRRVMDMPCSENAMTGVAIGAALAGMRPILTHQRVDFALLSLDQIINNAAKWHAMFGGRMRVPLVIRMIIGRGWGQGPQHSQSLQALFAHVPGLKVVMPATPADAKGLLVSAIRDDGPVIYLEHRWSHGLKGPVPEAPEGIPLGRARVARRGTHITIVAMSHLVIEALRAAEHLARHGVDAEVLDLRSLRPLDLPAILGSVGRTGRLLVADQAWKTGGFGAEIVARVAEEAFASLQAPPARVAFPDLPAPTSPALAERYYPGAEAIVARTVRMLGLPELPPLPPSPTPSDVPDLSFTGPF